MVRRLCRRVACDEHRAWDQCIPAGTARCLCLSTVTPQGEPSMTWTTPAATDLRFGFEITMYVSAR